MFKTEKCFLTEHGGLAVLMTAHETLREGDVVYINSNGKARLIQADIPAPVGVVYAPVNADADVWVVVSGIAKVRYNVATTAGYLARGYLAEENGYEAGCAYCEELPRPPFDTDKHFYEIGHPMETVSLTNGYALAKTLIHFL